MKIYTKILLFSLSFGLFSCVSTKKYNELQNQKDYYEQAYNDLKIVEQQKNECEEEKAVVQARLRQTEQEVADLTLRIQTLDRSNQDMLHRYEDLLNQNRALVNASSSEIRQLTEKLAKQSDELDTRKERLDSLQSELALQEEKLASWQQRIEELQAAMNEKDSRMQMLRDKINQALVGFSATDLTVTPRNGKLYVSLSQNLLFKSGSDDVNANGKKALQQLAGVLKSNPEIEVMVEGHTDNVGTASFNWDLSTSRATSVVKVLAEYGVDQTRMTAAGRSYFQPVVENDSDANKAKNRRVEIILSPKLEELFEIIR
ncbi:MAG: OmpA family protein [Saprospiraceae bacterium]|nr:OmpA family protein [Saprospiraceae bacterium]